MVMTVDSGDALPSGPFEVAHRSLQSGLRAWVERQTGRALGYLEQLYTFADRERGEGVGAERRISISYLGLTRAETAAIAEAGWRRWYDYFPWEDRRQREVAVARSVDRAKAQGLDCGWRLARGEGKPQNAG